MTTIYLQSGATEADINAALAQLPAGGTIVFPHEETIEISNGLNFSIANRDITLDLNGSTLQQTGNATVIQANGYHLPAQAATLGTGADGHVTVTFPGGANLQPGSWVKIFSDDPLPNDHVDGSQPTRLGQAMQVVSVDGDKVTLAGDLLDGDLYQTNVRVSPYVSGHFVLENGTVSGNLDQDGWNRDLVQVRSAVDAVVDNVTVENSHSFGINVVDSVHTLVKGAIAKNLVDDPNHNAFGIAVHSASSLGTTVEGLYAEHVRHAADDNAVGVLAGNNNPSQFGADIGMTVKDAIAYETTAFSYSWHSEARGALFEHVMSFDSYGFMGARGVGNAMVDSYGVNDERGLQLYEYGDGDGYDLTFDGIHLKETVYYAWIATNHPHDNVIENSSFEVAAPSPSLGDAADLINVTLKVGLTLDETIAGTSDADTLLGGKGVDVISGGAGNDYIWGGEGIDVMSGGAGTDHFAYHRLEEAGDVIVDFQAGEGGDVLDLSVLAAHYGWSGDPIASGHVQVVGVGADTLLQVCVDGSVVTLATLVGVSPSALTWANLNTDLAPDPLDHVTATTALPTLLLGTDGNDTITGGSGTDLIIGGGGDDRLDGGEGDDVLVGGKGADVLIGRGGSNAASYADADQGVVANLLDPTANTGDAAGDRYSGIQHLIGSIHDDLLVGNAGSNRLEGGGGDDVLIGGDGCDTLLGGAGSDHLDGGAKADVLQGGAGDDTLIGGDGADSFVFVAGEGGTDRIADFASGQDHVLLAGFGIDDIQQLAFISGADPAAASCGPTLLYDTGSGTLAWDADGAGSGGEVVLAVLTGAPKLALTDFGILA